jgi:hypothetical protein
MEDTILSEFGIEPSLDNNTEFYEFLETRQAIVRKISKVNYFLNLVVEEEDDLEWLLGTPLYTSLEKWTTASNDKLEPPFISDLLNLRKILVIVSVPGYSRRAVYENLIETLFKCPAQVFDAIFPEVFFVYLVPAENWKTVSLLDPPGKSCTITYDDTASYFPKSDEVLNLVEFLNQIK